MKKYNISEVAKIMGISSESLRNYERRGLIAPLRDENGYRTYARPDIYIMSGIRRLRNSGYSFDEIEQLHKAEHEQTVEIKRSRCKQLEAEIVYAQHKLAALRQECAEYEDLPRSSGIVEWTTSPAALRVNNQINDDFVLNDKSVTQWVEHTPIVQVSPAFSKEAILRGTDEIRFGYAVPLELAAQLGLDDTPGAQVKPARRCLTIVVHSHGEQYLCARLLAPVVEYCRQNGLEIEDDAWGVTLGTNAKDGVQIRYHRLYIPVCGEGVREANNAI